MIFLYEIAIIIKSIQPYLIKTYKKFKFHHHPCIPTPVNHTPTIRPPQPQPAPTLATHRLIFSLVAVGGHRQKFACVIRR